MPALQIRNLPDELYQTLVRKAAEERRSLSQQAIVALSKGLSDEIDPKARLRDALRRAAAIDPKKTRRLLDPVKLIREDRSTQGSGSPGRTSGVNKRVVSER
jgi:plasmid stability protein